ncbi:inner membrane protein [Salmonella sp. NCTC 11881]|nr:inner membrane protein [Salmonella sp. NCTC 11881]
MYLPIDITSVNVLLFSFKILEFLCVGFYLMKKYTFAARAFIFTLVLLFVISVFGLTISVLKGM